MAKTEIPARVSFDATARQWTASPADEPDVSVRGVSYPQACRRLQILLTRERKAEVELRITLELPPELAARLREFQTKQHEHAELSAFLDAQRLPLAAELQQCNFSQADIARQLQMTSPKLAVLLARHATGAMPKRRGRPGRARAAALAAFEVQASAS